jgi:Putative Ig domain
MMISRKCWKLLPILLAGATLHATPTITGVFGCPGGANQGPQIGGGITAGTNIPQLQLCIYGAFSPAAGPVTTWLDNASGGTITFTPVTSQVTATFIVVNIPKALFTSVVTPGKSDGVTITVNENGNISNSSFSVNPALQVGAQSFPGTAGTALTANLYNFGTAPYANVLNSGGGPPGMNAFPTTSPTWSGTPSAAGVYPFNFTVTDVWGNQLTAALSFNIQPAALHITTFPTLPGGQQGVAYSTTFAATGGVPPYTFTVIKGSPAPGLVLAPNGTLSGTPTAFGQFLFTVQAADSANNVTSVDAVLNIAPAKLVLTTGPLGTAILNTPLNIQFTATGGVTPYTFVEIGPLPPGLAFSASGALTGSPTTLGVYQFQVFVNDSAKASATNIYNISIVPPGLVITTASPLPSGVIGTPYATTIKAAGGIPPYTWSAKGLPAGLVLANTTGLLAGIPTQDGLFTASITVTDATLVAVVSTTVNFALTISPVTLAITNLALPNGTVASPYSAVLTSTGGDAPITFTGTGLPPGVVLSAAGVLSGSPTTAGTYTVNISATDVNGLGARTSYSVTIAPQLVITTTSAGAATLGAAFSAKLAATGGTPPYVWLGSSLPPGISLAQDGTLSGTPTLAGSYPLAIIVVDSNSVFAQKTVPMTVGLPTGPPVTYTGIGATVPPASQPSVQVSLGATYPTDITVKLTMTVVTDSGLTDPAFQFSTGGLTATTVVKAGATGALTAIPVQMGTDAANVTITAQLLSNGTDVTPSPASKLTFRLAPAAPVITSISAVRTSGGFTVTIVGYATTRDVTTANFTFSATSGANLQTTQLPVTVTPIFSPWYSSATSAQYGSQFTFTQPFNVTGTNTAIQTVNVTLTNSVGTSTAAAANLQ